MDPTLDKDETRSCDARMSRKDFLKRLAGPAIATGLLFAPGKVVDKFVLQPAQAANTNSWVMNGRRFTPVGGSSGVGRRV